MPKKDNRKNRSRKQRADDARTRIKNTIVDFKFGGKAGSKKKYDCKDFDNNWTGRVDSIVGRVESALRFLDFCADQPADEGAEEDRRSESPEPLFSRRKSKSQSPKPKP